MFYDSYNSAFKYVQFSNFNATICVIHDVQQVCLPFTNKQTSKWTYKHSIKQKEKLKTNKQIIRKLKLSHECFCKIASERRCQVWSRTHIKHTYIIIIIIIIRCGDQTCHSHYYQKMMTMQWFWEIGQFQSSGNGDLSSLLASGLMMILQWSDNECCSRSLDQNLKDQYPFLLSMWVLQKI